MSLWVNRIIDIGVSEDNHTHQNQIIQVLNGLTLSLMLVLLCVTGFLLGLFEWIPGDLAACLSLGGLSLLTVWLLSHFEVAEVDSHLVSLPNRWSLLADLSLAWPPFSVWTIG